MLLVDRTNINHMSDRLMTKPTKWYVRPVNTQISLGIRPVWLESSLSAWRKTGSLATHWAQAQSLIRLGGCLGFAGRKVISLILSWGGWYIQNRKIREKSLWYVFTKPIIHQTTFEPSPYKRPGDKIIIKCSGSLLRIFVPKNNVLETKCLITIWYNSLTFAPSWVKSHCPRHSI